MGADSHYHAGRAVAGEALRLLRAGQADGRVAVAEPEERWLDMMQSALDGRPEDEEELIAAQVPMLGASTVRLEDYGL